MSNPGGGGQGGTRIAASLCCDLGSRDTEDLPRKPQLAAQVGVWPASEQWPFDFFMFAFCSCYLMPFDFS